MEVGSVADPSVTLETSRPVMQLSRRHVISFTCKLISVTETWNSDMVLLVVHVLQLAELVIWTGSRKTEANPCWNPWCLERFSNLSFEYPADQEPFQKILFNEYWIKHWILFSNPDTRQWGGWRFMYLHSYFVAWDKQQIASTKSWWILGCDYCKTG